MRLYSYVLRYDDGAAPNPYWGMCTLVICKPDIRRTAKVGDWVIGTGSKKAKHKDGKIYDYSDSIVYAMRVSLKLSLRDYDSYCLKNLPNKVPKWFNRDFRLRIGDCIYDYSSGRNLPRQRKGVHGADDIDTDLSGKYALLSDHFYYFGEEPRPIPDYLNHLIKRGRKHKVITDQVSIADFDRWIAGFKKNKLYADPQLKLELNNEALSDKTAGCVKKLLKC